MMSQDSISALCFNIFLHYVYICYNDETLYDKLYQYEMKYSGGFRGRDAAMHLSLPT